MGAHASLNPFDRVDEFELLAPVSRDRDGSLWLARPMLPSAKTEELVALRVLPWKIDADSEAVQRLLAFKHDHVVRLLKVGSFEDRSYAVLEWVDADPVSRLLDRVKKVGPLPIPVAARVVVDACRAVHAVHRLGKTAAGSGFLHGSLSPKNLFITKSGLTKVSDFGLHPARVSGQPFASDDESVVSHSAPEWATGARVDERADVWSLAAIGYELLSGRAPFAAETAAMSVERMMLAESVDPLPRDVCNEALAAVMARALSFHPRLRFDTARQFGDAVEAAVRSTCGLATTVDVRNAVAAYTVEQSERRQRLVQTARESVPSIHSIDAEPESQSEASATAHPESTRTYTMTGIHGSPKKSYSQGIVAATQIAAAAVAFAYICSR
jgi:serine/threonine-protein kinase